jgi:hypothetical protein
MATPIILADNRFLNGTPTATDTATGYSVFNLRDLKSFTSWKAASSGTKYLTVDCGSAKAADTLGIFKHNLGTAAATVSVESSPDNSTWTNRLTGFVPGSDKAILKNFTTQTYRYWRVKIVTASIAAQVAEVMLGSRITFPYPPETPFTPASLKIEAETTKSKTGQLLGMVVRFKPYTISARWSALSRSWVDATFRPFFEDYASELKPFFWAWDLDTFPSDVRFVTIDPEMSMETPVSILATYDSVSLEMIGVKE